jgi:DNA (cytosine-5)-methyltransferase 1
VTRIGSLFSGYGGLDMAVQSVYGGTLSWYSEIEPAACAVLAAHHPGVPNLGDITVVDWAEVEPVDILTGGYPCQPFSHAGKRKGTDDERHLWPYVAAATNALRPRLVVLENVPGHRSMGLADVIADLAGLGYAARWATLRAADAGAPHSRARLFIVAHPDSDEVGRRVVAQPDSTMGAGTGGSGLLVAADRVGENGRLLDDIHGPKRAATLARWGQAVGRACPDHIVTAANGAPALNPRFVEWCMGLPDGWVTGHELDDVPVMAMLGNGVVSQQAALALRMLAVAP